MINFIAKQYLSSFKWCVNSIHSIAEQQSRNIKIQILNDTIQHQPKPVQECFIQFMLAQIDSPLANKQIIVSESALFKAVAGVYKQSYETICQMEQDTGDLSEVVYQLQTQLQGSVELVDIFNKLTSLYSPDGYGKQETRIQQITQLLQMCHSPLESRYLIRFLQKKMRIGLNAKSISKIVDETLNQKLLGYQNDVSNIVYGIPILPMMAKSYTVADELVNDFVNKKNCADSVYFIEYKYDGERLQVHYQDGQVQLYGRSLESKTQKFIHLAEQLREYFQAQQIQSGIFDCEMVCYRDNKIIPFQDMQNQNIANPELLSLICFDTIMLNGVNLIPLKYSDRQNHYKQVLQPCNNIRQVICHIESIKYTSLEQLSNIFEEALSKGLEGLIVKRDSAYTPGLRNEWAKLKKQKDVDLVVIGAYYGKGKRKQLFGAFLLGAYNAELDIIYPITKIGTGFSDDNLQEFTTKLRPLALQERPDNVYVSVVPDVWLMPQLVWEINYDVITTSPTYILKNQEFTGGLSFRFPRFVRERPDKQIPQSSDVNMIIEQYLTRLIF